MILHCDLCGRPLEAADVVGETRRCIACSGPLDPAVLAGLNECWSQGQVEGHINRLKYLKRQSYGRAGLALLQQRVLQRSAAHGRFVT